MSHKQASLFDFDVQSSKEEVVKLLPLLDADEAISILKEDPVETNIIYNLEKKDEKVVLPKEPKRGRRKMLQEIVLDWWYNSYA